MAAPVSYRIGDTQYISVAVGWGGHYGLEWGPLALAATGGLPNVSRVLTFKLDGQAVLPTPSMWEGQRRPAVPITNGRTPAIEAEGRLLYTRYCAACHGGAAISGGVLPDLRNMSPEVYEYWDDIVLDGARAATGMVGFKENIYRRQSHAIRDYVLTRAHRSWNERPKPERRPTS
jgi:alcohol dehydrogenase (cytochrome c)/quinohemoprotein ethanol dehydrogenase